MNRIIAALILCAVVVVAGIAGIAGLGFYRGWFLLGSHSTGDKSDITLSFDKEKFQGDRKTATKQLQDLGNQVTGKTVKHDSMDGTVVSVTGDKLTMANTEGKEHDHTLTADIKMTCDGKDCTAADLKSGMRIRVTMNSEAPHAVSRIEALDKNPDFAKAG